MRYALAAVLVLLTACATGGVGEPVVPPGDAPFTLVQGGFSSEIFQLAPYASSGASSEEMTFIFKNGSDRAQSAESLLVKPRNHAYSIVRLTTATVPIGRTIAPGETFEVKMRVSVTPMPSDERRGKSGPFADAFLTAGGKTYQYPVSMARVRPGGGA